MSAYPVRGIYRAYRNTDTPLTAWVRDEAGKLDMTGQTVEVAIPYPCPGWGYDYQIGTHGPELIIPATSPEAGKVEFTITAGNINQKLQGPAQVLFIRADGVTVGTGLLEIVG